MIARNPDLLDSCLDHFGDQSWREVWLLLSNLMNPDFLLPRLKYRIDSLIEGEVAIQNLLEWVKGKATSMRSEVRRSALRSLYIWLGLGVDDTLAISSGVGRALVLVLARKLTSDLCRTNDPPPTIAHDFERVLDIDFPIEIDFDIEFTRAVDFEFATSGLDLDCDLDLTLTIIRNLALTLTRNLDVDGTLDRADSINLDLTRSLDRALDRAMQIQPALATDLRTLIAEKPRVDERSAWKNWSERLQSLLRHRDLGHAWSLSGSQIRVLRSYFSDSSLLLACMNEARDLKHATRDRIEDEMLLPAASLAKYRATPD